MSVLGFAYLDAAFLPAPGAPFLVRRAVANGVQKSIHGGLLLVGGWWWVGSVGAHGSTAEDGVVQESRKEEGGGSSGWEGRGTWGV